MIRWATTSWMNAIVLPFWLVVVGVLQQWRIWRWKGGELGTRAVAGCLATARRGICDECCTASCDDGSGIHREYGGEEGSLVTNTTEIFVVVAAVMKKT